MLIKEWLRRAKANGWDHTGSKGQTITLSCSKVGCPGCLTLPMMNLGPVPAPCDLPHSGQYAAPVIDEYHTLVDEMTRQRRSLGLSQEDVNAAAGLADGHIAKLESFARYAQFPTLKLWAQTLGLSLTLTPAPLPMATQRAIEGRQTPLRTTQKALIDGN